MRHVDAPPAPASLSEQSALNERAKLKEFYDQPGNEEAPYPGTFSAYKHAQVRSTLSPRSVAGAPTARASTMRPSRPPSSTTARKAR